MRYWEEFGTIAFDPAHDTLLTACSLKSPNDRVKHVVNCCFSFRIRRDDHKVYVRFGALAALCTFPDLDRPSLIIGNFLPHDPEH